MLGLEGNSKGDIWPFAMVMYEFAEKLDLFTWGLDKATPDVRTRMRHVRHSRNFNFL